MRYFNPGFVFGGWRPTYAPPFGSQLDSAGWNGFTLRMVIPTSLLTRDANRIRLWLRAGAAGSCTIDDAYFGQQAASGDTYDFLASNKVRITANGGSTTFTTNLGTKTVSDVLTFTLDKTKVHVLSAHFSATSSIRRGSATGAVKWEKNANDASTDNATGYVNSVNDFSYLLEKIEAHG